MEEENVQPVATPPVMAETKENLPSSQEGKSNKTLWIILTLVLLVLIVGAVYYVMNAQTPDASGSENEPGEEISEDPEELINSSVPETNESVELGELV